MSLDLFNWAEGQARRDDGMARAAEAQEREVAGWGERAYQAIVTLAHARPTVHVDDVLGIFDEPPQHPTAWGTVWSRALKAGIIERSGMTRQSRDPRKHRHVYPVYRSRVCNA